MNAWANQHRGWERVRWIKAAFLKELPPLVKSKRAKGRKRVTITRVLGPRERLYDPDNLVGACKPLLDALRAAGYIEDDTAALIDLHVAQDATARSAGPKILVSIRERR
jgi:Holliday junction resolvase RusA-like endonuclease